MIKVNEQYVEEKEILSLLSSNSSSTGIINKVNIDILNNAFL